MEVHITEARVYKDLNDITKAKVPSSHYLHTSPLSPHARWRPPPSTWTSPPKPRLIYSPVKSMYLHFCSYTVELSARLPVRLLLLLRGLRCADQSEGCPCENSPQVHGADEDSLGERNCGAEGSIPGVQYSEHFPEPPGGRKLGARHGGASSHGRCLPET